MSKQIVALNKRKAELEARQEVILNAGIAGNRSLNDAEKAELTTLDNDIKDVNDNVARFEALAKSSAALKQPVTQPVVADGDVKKSKFAQKKIMSDEYFETFYKNVGKLGKIENNILFEGADTDSATGGVVAPILFDGQVIPLAPNNLALRQLAFVTPTENDIKIPVQLTRSAAAKKLQSTSGGNHGFSATNPTIKLVTLSADMNGNFVPVSLEALQDIGYMQAFVQNDISYAVQDAEEVAYTTVLLDGTNGAVHFTGTLTEPEDYLDMTVQPDKYDAGSAWLMPKRKAISLKKAQVAANQFNPFWTTINGRDYFHGYPVYFSSKLEDLGSPAADAVVFGNFNQGMVIGDRNNGAVLVKVDDITNFQNGIINIYGYRRSGSLVRDRNALRSTIVL